MSLFSPEFAAAVATRAGAQECFTVVDLMLPTTTSSTAITYRYTDSGNAVGTYLARGRVLNIGSIQHNLSLRPSDLGLPSTSVTVADTDAALSSLLRGRFECRLRSAYIRIGHPDVLEHLWFIAHSGVIDDWETNGTSVTLTITAADRPLQGYLPNRQIMKGWAPFAPDEVLGNYLPVVLGCHDLETLDTKGAVPLIPISLDTSKYRWLVSLGTVKTVSRVYRNGGTPLTGGTGANQWTAQQETLGGMTMTTVWLHSPSVAPTVADAMTADVDGITDTGATTGSVISNPVEQLKWGLNNLVYSDWAGGAYASASLAPLDGTSLGTAAAYLDANGYESSKYVGGTKEQMTGLQFVNDWLRSHMMIRPRWHAGKLGLRVIDHRFNPYSSDAYVNLDVDHSFRFSSTADEIVTKVSLDFLYDTAGSRYWGKMEVQDLIGWQVETVSQNYQLGWSSSRFT